MWGQVQQSIAARRAKYKAKTKMVSPVDRQDERSTVTNDFWPILSFSVGIGENLLGGDWEARWPWSLPLPPRPSLSSVDWSTDSALRYVSDRRNTNEEKHFLNSRRKPTSMRRRRKRSTNILLISFQEFRRFVFSQHSSTAHQSDLKKEKKKFVHSTRRRNIRTRLAFLASSM